MPYLLKPPLPYVPIPQGKSSSLCLIIHRHHRQYILNRELNRLTFMPLLTRHMPTATLPQPLNQLSHQQTPNPPVHMLWMHEDTHLDRGAVAEHEASKRGGGCISHDLGRLRVCQCDEVGEATVLGRGEPAGDVGFGGVFNQECDDSVGDVVFVQSEDLGDVGGFGVADLRGH
jgi:hypothetical protein